MPAQSLALLIDGDNASPRIISGLLAEIANYGTASVKRVYGDWTKPNLNGWKDCLLEHSLQPVQQFAYTTGKGATDGAMIIDAMDLLYTERFSGFCLVSSDSDFTRLASRIREQGLVVYGFGERKTPRPFITACDKFVYFDVLKEIAPPAQLSSSAPALTKAQGSEATVAQPLISMIIAAQAASSDENGWATLAEVGSRVAKQIPEFDSRNYGFTRLSELVDATKRFELDRSGKSSKGVLIRIKGLS